MFDLLCFGLVVCVCLDDFVQQCLIIFILEISYILVQIFPKYLIFLAAIVNGISFTISFSVTS